ncbi:hypothetical protein T492DRAFT_1108718 [Pavlovales sp. CCMP2436]|nr:hypothetical protein T492DRAFT_1108718 [Pavlovales sp. CCMP2436]
MFIDSAEGCQRLVVQQRHNALGTLEYFAWSLYTLYCYGCSEAEVLSGSRVPDKSYDVYVVYSMPWYDPVMHFAQRPICHDTPGWHNPDFSTCATYAERHWCIDGVMEWQEHFGGEAFRYPEKHCCACGGGSATAPAPSPPPSDNPLPCVDLLLHGTPAPEQHLVRLATPGQAGLVGPVSKWHDPSEKTCADYAVKAWCSQGQLLSRRVAGIRNHNPEDACCVCGASPRRERARAHFLISFFNISKLCTHRAHRAAFGWILIWPLDQRH